MIWQLVVYLIHQKGIVNTEVRSEIIRLPRVLAYDPGRAEFEPDEQMSEQLCAR